MSIIDIYRLKQLYQLYVICLLFDQMHEKMVKYCLRKCLQELLWFVVTIFSQSFAFYKVEKKTSSYFAKIFKTI